MAANRFFVPNTEEFSEDLIALLQQCGLCCQEYSDGGLTEFLGAWDEEPVSKRYYCSIAIENSVDQKSARKYLKCFCLSIVENRKGCSLHFSFLIP